MPVSKTKDDSPGAIETVHVNDCPVQKSIIKERLDISWVGERNSLFVSQPTTQITRILPLRPLEWTPTRVRRLGA